MEIYEHNSVHTNSDCESHDKARGGLVGLKLAVVVAVLTAFAAIVISCVGASSGADTLPNAQSAFESVRASVTEVYGANTQGSGVVYKISSGKTYIITNNHVTAGAQSVKVRFADFGTRVDAQVLGFDAYHDIALLEADGDFGAVPAVAASSPANGESVISVGNNLGYGISVFEGIVSQRNRILNVTESAKAVPVYAVSAAINPGMSGGGVFTLGGEIIGIGTYQVSSVSEDLTSRPVQSMNFCVPYSIAARLASAILASDTRGELKNTISAEADIRSYGNINFIGLGFEANVCSEGLKINSVSAFPPLDINGTLAEGDIVSKIGSLNIDSSTTFADIFAECLKYKTDSDADSAPLVLELKRGEERATVSYDKKRVEYA